MRTRANGQPLSLGGLQEDLTRLNLRDSLMVREYLKDVGALLAWLLQGEQWDDDAPDHACHICGQPLGH